MKYNVTMPSLGADMEHGKLLKWYIKPGDAIKKGDLIAMVETQKSAVDIESFRSGTVLELIGEIDALIDVGAVIAVMEVEADGDAAGDRQARSRRMPRNRRQRPPEYRQTAGR